jgi:thiamine pyrophosphate-dependent acetolactate synthase large subunit-like protein
VTEDHFENYIEKSFEEIDAGNINQVVKTDLVIGTAMRELLVKLLIPMKHKEMLTNLEIEGIISEVKDAKVWHKEKLEERYQAQLKQMQREITDLEEQLKKDQA